MSRIEGADEMIKALSSLADNEKKIERAMLTAGGEVMEDAWRTAIQAAGHLRTHAMYDNVASKVKLYTGNGMKAIITSEGVDARGVRNGYKAFLTHYGNSRQPGSHWIDYAEEIGMPASRAAMEAVLSQAIEGTIDVGKLPSGTTYEPFNYTTSYWMEMSKRAQKKSKH